MYAVIFEVQPKADGKKEYLSIAKKLQGFLENQAGLISIERFQSLGDERKLLSLSFWENEEAIREWRNVVEHREGQIKGKSSLFHSYRIRVAEVVRDYTASDRSEASADSKSELTG